MRLFWHILLVFAKRTCSIEMLDHTRSFLSITHFLSLQSLITVPKFLKILNLIKSSIIMDNSGTRENYGFQNYVYGSRNIITKNLIIHFA